MIQTILSIRFKWVIESGVFSELYRCFLCCVKSACNFFDRFSGDYERGSNLVGWVLQNLNF
jgi:hypothetical protein